MLVPPQSLCPSGLSLLSSGLGPGILDTGLDCAATGWAGLGLALATLHDWTPWPVRTSRVPPHSFSRCSKDTLSVSSLLPILLLLLHPRCRPLTNLLPQEPDQSRRPPTSAAAAWPCHLALSSFYFPRPLFFAPFIPLSRGPACFSPFPRPTIQSPPARSCSNFYDPGEKHSTPFSVQPSPSTRMKTPIAVLVISPPLQPVAHFFSLLLLTAVDD